jgi:hypothetical protein
MAGAATRTRRTDAATITASVPVALGPDRGAAARIAARWLLTYATRMGPLYPKTLRGHGYHRELDALVDANPNPHQARLPPAAERLAHDVLFYGTYDEVPELCQKWHKHADDLALVAPFGVPAEQITDTIEAISSAVTEHSCSADISAAIGALRVGSM